MSTVLLYCRKVAVPVPDGYTWGEFLQQVRTKLKITGVQEITLASVSVQRHHSIFRIH